MTTLLNVYFRCIIISIIMVYAFIHSLIYLFIRSFILSIRFNLVDISFFDVYH